MKKYLFVLCLCLIAVFSLHADISGVDLAEELGGSFYYEPASGTCIIYKGLDEARFIIGGSFVMFNSTELAMNMPSAFLKDSSITIPDKTAQAIKDFFTDLNDPSILKVGAIVIDPGHGGKDPGAVRKKNNGKSVTIVEKDITLKIGLQLQATLKRRYPNKKIIMTRSSDVFIELDKRSEIANKLNLPPNEAVIYISIHVNAAVNTRAVGFEVNYLLPEKERDFNSKIDAEGTSADILPFLSDALDLEVHRESKKLADTLLGALKAKIGDESPSRGVKEANFSVVRRSLMPAVLIEVGFLSNLEEARLLLGDKYLMKISEAIYNGIRLFVEDFEKTNGFTESQNE